MGVENLLVMLCMMVVMSRRMSVLVAFDTSYACRRPSPIIAIIIEHIGFILDSLWLSALLRTNPPHHLTGLLCVLTILGQRTPAQWCRRSQPTKTGEHAPELALDARILASHEVVLVHLARPEVVEMRVRSSCFPLSLSQCATWNAALARPFRT
jgi:hypothetical protein